MFHCQGQLIQYLDRGNEGRACEGWWWMMFGIGNGHEDISDLGSDSTGLVISDIQNGIRIDMVVNLWRLEEHHSSFGMRKVLRSKIMIEKRNRFMEAISSFHMDVSKNNGTPKSSILIGFSIINHPFWGTPIFGNTHIWKVIMLSTQTMHYYSVKSLKHTVHLHEIWSPRKKMGKPGNRMIPVLCFHNFETIFQKRLPSGQFIINP